MASSSFDLPLQDPDHPHRDLGLPEAHRGSPQEGRALCLSGGGYRAMLFHLGVLWRLNELGILGSLKHISAVSGGSILAAFLGLRWARLDFREGVAQNFVEEIVTPIRALAGETLDVGSVVRGVLLPESINTQFAAALRHHLYGKATLQDLPTTPTIVINATNLQTGKLWRFSREAMGDWTIGRIPTPRVQLAKAVAASAAFPPLLSPAVLTVKPTDFLPDEAGENTRPPFNSRILLADGGVYDNLGLETAFKLWATLIVSDAGMRPSAAPKVGTDPLRQTIRVLEVADAQVRALRKRQLLDLFTRDEPTHNGAYFSTNSDIRNYKLPDTLPCPLERTQQLATVPTRLAKMGKELQQRLINWGYAISDAGARRHLLRAGVRAPEGFPYGAGV